MTAQPETAAKWVADLDYLVDALEREHRDLFHSVSRARFDAAARSLRPRIPLLAREEIVIELARLVALVGDGHTRLSLAEVPGFRRYPLRLYHYADGLFVQGIAREHPRTAGSRLLAIDGAPATDAYEAMRPLISHDNEQGIKAAAPTLLTIPEVLWACGVCDAPEQASFVLQAADGERQVCTLAAVGALPSDLADARDGAVSPTPLWLRRSAEHNWCEYSGLRCTASALWWQYSLPNDDRPWIAPDIPAALWSADYAANRDPAVEAALSAGPLEGLPRDDRYAPVHFAPRHR